MPRHSGQRAATPSSKLDEEGAKKHHARHGMPESGRPRRLAEEGEYERTVLAVTGGSSLSRASSSGSTDGRLGGVPRVAKIGYIRSQRQTNNTSNESAWAVRRSCECASGGVGREAFGFSLLDGNEEVYEPTPTANQVSSRARFTAPR